MYQYIVYWIHFQNIHNSTYQKTLLHTLLLLVFKIIESLQCILKCIFLFSNLEICLIFAYVLMTLSPCILSNIMITKKGYIVIRKDFKFTLKFFNGFLRSKTIIFQNVSSEAQVKFFLFCRKVIFRSQDIQVFVFLTNTLFTKSVTSWWAVIHATLWTFEHILWP